MDVSVAPDSYTENCRSKQNSQAMCILNRNLTNLYFATLIFHRFDVALDIRIACANSEHPCLPGHERKRPGLLSLSSTDQTRRRSW